MPRTNLLKFTDENQHEREQQQDLAFRLFCGASNPSQKEIAKQIGVSEKTISRWIAKSQWIQRRDELRAPGVAAFIAENGSLRDRTKENLEITDKLKAVLTQRIQGKKDVLSGRELADFTRILDTINKLETRMYAQFGIEPSL